MADTQYLLDGQTDFSGGQDASKTPDKVADNEIFAGINVTTKNATLAPRNGFSHIGVRYPAGGVSFGNKTPIPYETIFKYGKFQAVIPHSIGQEYYLIIVVSGIIFLFNQTSYEISVVPITDGSYLDETQDRVNWSLASKYIVLFDFPSYPVIIDGQVARRADPAKFEVPISRLGCYNQNRLFIANGGNEYTAGDPTGSLAAPEAPVTFMEVEQSAAPFFGQIFQLPTAYGNNPITAMGFLQLTDTSSGFGPLIIATQNQVFAANSQNPRTGWDQGNFTSLIVDGAGIDGPRAMCNVNSDLFFTSEGELRTLSMSRNEQGRWSRVPISREVKNWLKTRDRQLNQFISIAYFQNKIFVTANPYRVKAATLNKEAIFDYVFGGLVVINLDNISNLNTSAPPVWDGLWTGMRPMDMCVNNKRMFFIAKDQTNINSVWELERENTWDTQKGKTRQVKSRVYTKNFMFQDPFQNKEFIFIDAPFENIRGDFKFNVEYRPSYSSKFTHWRSFEHLAPFEVCKIPIACEIQGLAPHSFNSLYLGSPNTNECDPVSNLNLKVFRKAQFKFDIEALTWELPMFKLKAVTMPESDTQVVCGNLNEVEICGECNTDWDIPPFESCETKGFVCQKH